MGNFLKREIFETNRALEFFSEKELTMQIGCSKNAWPLAMAKELIDNSLDACEGAGISPHIEAKITDDGFYISDNGPGLPDAVIEKSLDYMIRVSDKNHYISPSRGQLGNALKCLWAVPYVLDGEHGKVTVSTGGRVHHVDVSLDRIKQMPVIEHTVEESSFVRNGTFVKMYIPSQASLQNSDPHSHFYKMIDGYALMNPHAAFSVGALEFYRTDECRKWTPSLPTSAHWYTPETLRSLIAAMLANGSEKSLRAFVSEFRGLSGSAKQKRVVDALGLSRAALQDLVDGGDLNVDLIGNLLHEMKANSQPVKTMALGVIGEENLKQSMSDLLSSFKYKMIAGEAYGLPFVMEVAFGIFNDEANFALVAGLNFAPTLSNPFDALPDYLAKAELNDYDPCWLFVHLTSPKLDFTDRGKSKLALPFDIQIAMSNAVEFVTKEFTKAKRKAKRGERIRRNQLQKLLKEDKKQEMTVKDAAYQVFQWAYKKTSGPDNLPVNVRQLFYAARPKILELSGKDKFDYGYFSQTLIQDYLNEHPEETADWDVVYDARGKFVEPHTGKRVDLGTLAVRRYRNGWGELPMDSAIGNVSLSMRTHTTGPVNRFSYALYIEKEGFDELLQAGGIAQKYDMAIMSNKGMSVTALRGLVEELSAKGVTTFVLHDFDKAGFSIVNTLQNSTKRWTYGDKPLVIDLGLRLSDVLETNLESEKVSYGDKKDPKLNIMESGATKEEAAFLVSGGSPKRWTGKRVELNAMTSQQFLSFLERKFEEHGVKKVIPDEKTIQDVYVKTRRQLELQARMKPLVDEINKMTFEIPGNLMDKVTNKLERQPFVSWDYAVLSLAERTLHTGV